jgi:Icc-related predicted phosphoesterase
MMLLAISLNIAAQGPIKIIHGPYLQNVTESEATLVWITDKPSVAWVETAPDDKTHFYQIERPKYYDTRDGIKQTSTIHSVKLTNLSPDTRYRYRVCAMEVLTHVGHKVTYGLNAGTDVYSKAPLSFKTANPTSDKLSFVVVNDIHGRNEVMENLLNKADVKNADFVVFNGDMVSVFNDENQIFEGFMDKATQIFASEIPMYYTRGNHETRGAFAPSFHDYFSTKEEKLYYTFRQGPICFVVLDSGEDKPDTDIEYYGITDYDGYRTEQAEWLKKVVASEAYRTAPYKVIITHIPPFGDWHGNWEVENKFMPILREAKPDIMLCGHLHTYIHRKADNTTSFPIIVNSNNTVVKASADSKQLTLQILDEAGKTVDNITVKK